jgi:hypothetical protein
VSTRPVGPPPTTTTSASLGSTISPSIDCHRALFAQPVLASACGQCEWSVVRRVGCRSPTLVEQPDTAQAPPPRECTGGMVHLRPDHWSARRILTPRGPVDRRLARCAGQWPMRPWPFAAEIWGEVFAEPQRVRIGGRRVGVSMRWRWAESTRDWTMTTGEIQGFQTRLAAPPTKNEPA